MDQQAGPEIHPQRGEAGKEVPEEVKTNVEEQQPSPEQAEKESAPPGASAHNPEERAGPTEVAEPDSL
jgi:hypothetical protein